MPSFEIVPRVAPLADQSAGLVGLQLAAAQVQGGDRRGAGRAGARRGDRGAGLLRAQEPRQQEGRADGEVDPAVTLGPVRSVLHSAFVGHRGIPQR